MMSNYNEHYIFQAKELLKFITTTSHEAYIVGECLRDLVLDREIKEVEIYSCLSKESLMSLFSKEDIVEVLDNAVRVQYLGMTFLISLATEYSFDYKNKVKIKTPRRHYSTSLMDFLENKIYSVNTLAMGSNNIIHDCFTGRQDIYRKKIKMICDNPNLIFKDRPLKMLEAIRLVSELGFKLDDSIYKAIKKSNKALLKVNITDITREMNGIIAGKFAKRGIKLLIKSKLYKRMPLFKTEIKRLYNNYRREDEETFMATSMVKNKEYNERIAMAFNDSKRLEKVVQLALTWPKSNYDVTTLFENSLECLLKANVVNHNLGKAKNKQSQINKLYNHLIIKKYDELAITKKEIISLDNSLSEDTIDEILRDVCNKVLHGKIKNNYEAIKEYILKDLGKREAIKKQESLRDNDSYSFSYESIIQNPTFSRQEDNQNNDSTIENKANEENNQETLFTDNDFEAAEQLAQENVENENLEININDPYQVAINDFEALKRQQEELDRRVSELEIQSLKKELDEEIERKIKQSGLLEGLVGSHRESTYNTLKKVYYDVLVQNERYQRLDNKGDNNGND